MSSPSVSKPSLRKKRSVHDDGSPRPTAVKRTDVILDDNDKEQDGDARADSPSSSELSLVPTSSGSEEDLNDVFLDPKVPERRYIRDRVSHEDFEKINTSTRRAVPWVEAMDDDFRHHSRIFIFQLLVSQCNWLDQKYNFMSSNSSKLIRDLFKANPWLVSEIDECWSNPEGSFLELCHLELLQAPGIQPTAPSL